MPSSPLSSLGAYVRDRASLCTAIGALAGMLAGSMLAQLLLIHRDPIPAGERWRVTLMLALTVTCICWLVVVPHRRTHTPTLIFIGLLALAVAWLLTTLVQVVPALQLYAAIIGLTVGVTLGAIACRLCHGRSERHG